MKRFIVILIVTGLLVCSANVSLASQTAIPAFPPVAIAYGPSSAIIYEEISFDGSSSNDRNGEDDIISYSWDFDIERDSDHDGVPDNDVDSDEIKPTYSYEYTGNYFVKLTVTDSAGLKDEDELSVSVGFDQKHAVIMVGRYFGWLNLNPFEWGPPDWPNLKMMSQYYTWYLKDAARMYIKLRDTLGFKEENIHLFVKTIDPIKIGDQTFFEIPSEFDINWISDTSSKEILQRNLITLNNKMNRDDALFLCFIDHGGNEGSSTYFGCPFLELFDFVKYLFNYLKIPNPWDGDSGQRLWDYDLANYISGNQGTCIFALQPCNSGGFIDELSGDRRIICTSSRIDQVADTWIRGFREGLTSEGSIANAYEAGISFVKSYLENHPDIEQYDPLIDDNSDRIGSYFDEDGYDPETYGKDGYLASRTFLGINLDMSSKDTNILLPLLPPNEAELLPLVPPNPYDGEEAPLLPPDESGEESLPPDEGEEEEPLPPDEGEEESNPIDPIVIVSVTPTSAEVEEGETVDFTVEVTGSSGNNYYLFYGGDGGSESGYMGYIETISYTYSIKGTFYPDVEVHDLDENLYDASYDFAVVTVAATNPLD